MPLRMLSRILFNVNGVTQQPAHEAEASTWPLRSTPSAGALYPTELRLAALNVQGLDSGIYHHQPYEHGLELLTPHIAHDQLAWASLHADLIGTAAVVLYPSGDHRSA
jgi:SagB-type dehydrogenase family enzyme